MTFLGLHVGQYLTEEKIMALIRIAVLTGFGIPAIHFISRWVRKYTTARLSEQPGMVAGKLVYYTGLFLIVFSALNELGFQLNTILGAAGIVGIAVGFASQTSVSNIISGIFIMVERPFLINDFITIDGTTGQVMSIDMLSIKLRTEDNRFIRIPNETLIKNKLINNTRFPIRRIDIRLGIAYKEDIGHVRTILIDIADNNPLCLQEPAPQVILTGFGPSSIDFLFFLWTTKENFGVVQNVIQEEIIRRFNKEGIEIPFPHISVYAGSATKPFPVQFTGGDPANPS